MSLRRLLMAGAGVIITPHYWNPADKAAEITLSASDATATRSTTNDGSWRSVRSVTSRNSGKWYAECVNVASGSTNGAMIFGVGLSTASLSNYPGSGSDSWGAQVNNNIQPVIYHSGAGINQAGTGVTAGGYGKLAVDFDNGRIYFGDSAFGWYSNPSTATPSYSFTPNTTLFLMLGEQRSPQQCTLKNNPGENAGTIPTGYSMWN